MTLYKRPPLLVERWDVLVTAQDVARVVHRLQRLEALERFRAECRPYSLDRLVGLHVVHIAAPAEGPRLDRRRGLTCPRDVLFVEGGVLPRGHHADVDRCGAKT